MRHYFHELLPGARLCVHFYANVQDTDTVLIISDHSLLAEVMTAAVVEKAKGATVENYHLSLKAGPYMNLTSGLEAAVREASIVFIILCSPRNAPVSFRRKILDYRDKNGIQRKIFSMLGVEERTFTGSGALGMSTEDANLETLDAALETLAAAAKRLERVTHNVAVALTLADSVQVKSTFYDAKELQTDLELEVVDEVATISTGKVHKGSWGNLPSGEAFVLPLRGTAQGQVTVDRGVTELEAGFVPFPIRVQDGEIEQDDHYHTSRLTEVIDPYLRDLLTADNEDKTLQDMLTVSEFGIGTNPNARPTTDMEIEKIKGTVHIGIGSNTSLGGAVDAPNHTDLVLDKPVVTLNNKYKIVDEEDGLREDHILDIARRQNHKNRTVAGTDIPRGGKVERIQKNAKVVDGKLWRNWTDSRNNVLEVEIGAPLTAKAAAQLWDCFGGETSRKVGHLVDVYATMAKVRDRERSEVYSLLSILKRFGVITVVDNTQNRQPAGGGGNEN